jgi:CRP/FNR family cyclic AMP-dependent transcriptional regulator
MDPPVEALRNVPLFAELEDKDLELLARQLHERRFPEGAEITTEGSTGAGFFVILEGNADVSVGGEHRATLGPGDHFGEIALIDDGTRSASIVAATDLLCYGLTPWEFRPFVEEYPQVAWALLKTLARRTREA